MNKKIIYIVLAMVLILSCKKEQGEKDYLTFSGKIANHTVDSLYIFNFGSDKKVIRINTDGTFLDTLKIKDSGMFFINHEGKQYRTYARNGYDVHFSWTAKNMKETVKITGYGSESLNFFKDDYYGKSDFEKNKETYFELSKSEFKQKCEAHIIESLSHIPKSDTTFVAYYTDFLNNFMKGSMEDYDENQYFATVLGKGMASPKFVDYENYKGGKTSLDNFKGKYVFIDVWATWCGPCKKEIPFIQKLEKKYHGKNIEFVSISIDKKKDYDKWRKMIAGKKLTGVQIFDDNSTDSYFMKAYRVNSIPRFILLDPNGNIMTHDAPWPSEEKKINTLFNGLDF